MRFVLVSLILTLSFCVNLNAQRSQRGQQPQQPQQPQYPTYPQQTPPPPPPPQTRISREQHNINASLDRATNQAMRRVPKDSKIAIVNVEVADRSQREFLTGELELKLFEMDYIIIDRSELDRIREEMKLQYSGEVDDNDAVEMGKLSGADYIITCRIDGERDLRRLRLRVLETQTGRVAGVAAEPLL